MGFEISHKSAKNMKKRNAPQATPAKRAKSKSGKAIVPSSASSTFSVPRGIRNKETGLPKLLVVKHRYVSAPQTTAALIVANADLFQFRANGMFDPDATGAGHQPLLFDEMAALYNRFRVLSSKITVRGACSSLVATGAILSISTADAVAAAVTYTTAQEQPATKSRVIGFGETFTMTHSWNAKQYYAGNTMDNAQLSGTAAADPAEQTIYRVGFTGLSAGGVCSFSVDIEYTAVWDERQKITGS